jgi:hypothetical protein
VVSRSAAPRPVQRIQPATFPGRSPFFFLPSFSHIFVFCHTKFSLSTGKPSMTSVPHNDSPEASGGPEPRTAHVRFLTPTPPNFEPEIDYISTLKALSEVEGLDTATKMFLDGLMKLEGTWGTRSSARASVITSNGATDHLVDLHIESITGTEEDRVNWMYHEIVDFRQRVKLESQQRSCVVVATTHITPALQIIGAALDLDPGFLLHHMNEPSGAHISDADIASLSKAFASCVVSLRNGDDDHLDHAPLGPSCSIRGLVDHRKNYHMEDNFPARPAPARISCCQFSKYRRESFLSRQRCLLQVSH